MNMVKRRRFDKQFKLEVVQRSLDEDITLKQLSEELDIRVQTLSRWRREYLDSGEAVSFPGHGVEKLTEEQKENKRLKKALAEKELELEILKKAIGIFSKRDRTFTGS